MKERAVAGAKVEVFYSLQSDYCYFLLGRLLQLRQKQVEVVIRPVLGGVLRLPERFKDRDALEQRYFEIDTARTAEILGLPYAYPNPSPIAFKPGSLWIAEDEQPRNECLNRLFVGSVLAERGFEFLDTVGRMLWDGSTPDWDQGAHLAEKMQEAGLDLEDTLRDTSLEIAQQVLGRNAAHILRAGHWGVPLMVFEGEPFYGQDRFGDLLWRMKRRMVL